MNTNNTLTAKTITTAQIKALQAEALAADDIVQAVICRVALDDLECSEEEADEDGLPDYSGGGHSAEEMRAIREALRMSVEAAQAACADAINDARAQAD